MIHTDYTPLQTSREETVWGLLTEVRKLCVVGIRLKLNSSSASTPCVNTDEDGDRKMEFSTVIFFRKKNHWRSQVGFNETAMQV
jgi:hypothetical protein